MTTLAIGVLFVVTLGYVLWPVFGPEARPARSGRPPAAMADGEPLPLEQLEPPPRER